MAERNKIGILFGYTENWIGGSYYFINLIQACQQLKDELKPHFVIITDNASYKKIEETGYKYLSRLSGRFKYSIIERIINKLSRIIWDKNVIVRGYNNNQLPILFGYYEQLHAIKCKRKLYWVPDLQDKHHPEYLDSSVVRSRERQHKALACSKSEIVFSSEDAEKDFEHFYSPSLCRTYVVPFAVTLPSLDNIDATKILTKFNLPSKYLIVPNQFWSHKNHLSVIKAIELLKQENIEVFVVFTGNENTDKGKYAAELKAYVYEKKLQHNIFFLGFIDRTEQLVLIRESIAVVQPSLFEGWSTVIEDAKALNKFVIASGLAVHHEQLKNTEADFFEPLQIESLAMLIKKQLIAPQSVNINYTENILEYAGRIIKIINNAA